MILHPPLATSLDVDLLKAIMLNWLDHEKTEFHLRKIIQTQ